MCSPVTCRQCGKTTWTGCGQHVDAVKAKVPTDQWCGGHEQAAGRSIFPWLRR
ncbi:hypothetical protein [Demequina activiva]|uniref:Uncharacterized protein n=1 Tax=Demequina activiva TaxID=1582364 RepID=A0A919Q085_9MICO|nr:hypothetical protein [Demequina activiva]GIG53614.1 hypothetical protein Dac01nite_03660 [Demequina activiva]